MQVPEQVFFYKRLVSAIVLFASESDEVFSIVICMFTNCLVERKNAKPS